MYHFFPGVRKIGKNFVRDCGRIGEMYGTIYRRSRQEERRGGHECLGELHRVSPLRAIDHQLAKITAIRKLLDKLYNFLTCAVRCDLATFT